MIAKSILRPQWLIRWIFLTLIGLAGCAAPTAQTPSPIDQTSTVVAQLIATSQAGLSQTLAAQPSATPVATVPAGTPACRAADLAASATVQPSAGVLAITLRYTNHGAVLCALQGPPNIQLIGGDGNALELSYNLNCFGCGQPLSSSALPGPETQAAQIPEATQAAQAILTGSFGLASGKSAQVLLLWRNECNALPPGEITARLVLPGGGGNVDAPTGLYNGPACIDPGSSSTVTIGQYQ